MYAAVYQAFLHSIYSESIAITWKEPFDLYDNLSTPGPKLAGLFFGNYLSCIS